MDKLETAMDKFQDALNDLLFEMREENKKTNEKIACLENEID